MRKTTKLFLGFTAGLLLLCGCSAAEEKLGYENADVAKEALASASSVRMRCDLDNVDASGNIYADEKAAAYMKNLDDLYFRRRMVPYENCDGRRNQ